MNGIIKNIENDQININTPKIHSGDIVKVYCKIKEGNKNRIQVFKGIVLKCQGSSNRKTFTVKKNSYGINVEKTWPLYSPNIKKIDIIKTNKVRRAKLNYLKFKINKFIK